MIAAFLQPETAIAFELLLRATLLVGAAWAAAAALQRAGASASARYLAWLLGIAALLALPLLWWLAPALRIPILPANAPLSAALSGPVPVGSAAPASSGDQRWGEILLIGYGIGAGLLMLRFAACHGGLSRLWRGSHPGDSRWERLLCRVSRDIGLSQSVELRIASDSVMPLTWGTLKPKVLLPAEANAWPHERRRLVLLHELAHVARRDSLARSAASLACIFYWFHPGVWFAARQMRLEQEHAADDQVLAAGAPARTYALSLLHMARREGGACTHHGAAMAEICQLERRVISITTAVRRESPGLVFLCASGAIASLLTLAAAAGVLAKRSAELPDSLREEHSSLASLPAKQAEPLPPEPHVASETPPRTFTARVHRVEEGSREAGDADEARAVASMPGDPGPILASVTQFEDAYPRPLDSAPRQEDGVDRRETAQPQPVYGPQWAQPSPNQDWNERLPELRRPRSHSGLWTRRGPRTAAKLLSLALSVAASASEQPNDLPQ